MRPITALILVLALAIPARAAESPGWQDYRNSLFGYSIDLPTQLFPEASISSDGLDLFASSGGGKLRIYAGSNLRAASPQQLAETLSGADQVKKVTYRAGGQHWLVLSGYYRDTDSTSRPVIFYTKLMFNADLSAVSAFEISYPVSEKPSYDSVVAHLERSLTPPR